MKKFFVIVGLGLLTHFGAANAGKMLDDINSVNKSQAEMRRQLGMKPLPSSGDSTNSAPQNNSPAPGAQSGSGTAPRSGAAPGGASAGAATNGSTPQSSPATGASNAGGLSLVLLGCSRRRDMNKSVVCGFSVENQSAKPLAFQVSDIVLTNVEQIKFHNQPTHLKSGVTLKASEKLLFIGESPTGFDFKQVKSIQVISKQVASQFENVTIY